MLFAKGIKSYFDHKDLGGEREWGEGGGTTKVREYCVRFLLLPLLELFK